MARKLRLEEEGGLYHVINRGNYRHWIFADEAAKAAFERALFHACERSGWLLQAFCIMGNHFHLAVETPRGNLSEGMRWLQATFANRFNRFRGESGRLFQGRFKSLTVEDSQRLAWLCHYIHLNPVRAGICGSAALADYRWSSLWYLHHRAQRPKCVQVETFLTAAGIGADDAAGWRRYGEYLAWLVEDEPARKQMEFERMSRGWAIGDRSFRKALVQGESKLRTIVRRSRQEAREARELAWEAALETALKAVGKASDDIAAEAKAAPWKVAVAALLKSRLSCTNAWLGARLDMGVEFGVSRYVSEMAAGTRPAAAKLYRQLIAKIK